MTLAEIMRLALRQLDEDPADISEFADLFRNYANLGYKILVTRFLLPKETISLRTDEKGVVNIDGMGIDHIIQLTGMHGYEVPYRISMDGMRLETTRRNEELTAVCVVSYPPMREDSEEPRIPEHAHHALVDYVCYRYLMNGNAAKQSRAAMYYQHFDQTARTILRQGNGDVKGYRNLYAATDIRNVGW